MNTRQKIERLRTEIYCYGNGDNELEHQFIDVLEELEKRITKLEAFNKAEAPDLEPRRQL
jgi:hypothetical protein